MVGQGGIGDWLCAGLGEEDRETQRERVERALHHSLSDGMPPPPTHRSRELGAESLPGVPTGQQNPSAFLLLINMFDPATEAQKDEDFHLDIQEDVKEECQAKFGKVC